jgi:hypothetical protein
MSACYGAIIAPSCPGGNVCCTYATYGALSSTVPPASSSMSTQSGYSAYVGYTYASSPATRSGGTTALTTAPAPPASIIDSRCADVGGTCQPNSYCLGPVISAPDCVGGTPFCCTASYLTGGGNFVPFGGAGSGSSGGGGGGGASSGSSLSSSSVFFLVLFIVCAVAIAAFFISRCVRDRVSPGVVIIQSPMEYSMGGSMGNTMGGNVPLMSVSSQPAEPEFGAWRAEAAKNSQI